MKNYIIKILILCVCIFSFSSCSHFGKNELSKPEFVHLWVTDVFKTKQFGSKKHETAAPLIINNDLFQGGSDGNLYVINKRSGSIKRSIKDSGGIDATPAFSQGVLYFGTNDGYIKAFSYRTGDYVWSYYVGFPVQSTPFIYDGRLFVMASNDILYALDSLTGKVLWTVRRDFPARRPVVFGQSSPVCFDNTVYAGFSDGTFVAVNMFNGATVFEKNLGSRTKFKDVDSNPYVDQQYIVVASYDGSIYCLERVTGNVIWNMQEGSAKSARVIDGKVYYSSNEGGLYVLDLKTGSVLWSVILKDGGIPTAPAIMGDYLIVGSSERGIVVYNKNNGKLLYEFNSGTGVFADPVVDSEMVYFFSNYGVLYAFRSI
jgi:outer membrane protein assembly factor BamB